MLHEARMNFQRTIVNQAPRFPCRGAAQFNPGLEVLRRDYGGAVEGEGEDLGWPSRSFSIHQFTANRQMRPLRAGLQGGAGAKPDRVQRQARC
jgi:hypothetical protein